MRILLVLPAAAHLRVTAADREVPRRAMLRFSVLPLTTVAALTPPGHEVRVCDENVEALDPNAEVDLVGISLMTAVAPRAYEIAAAFRRRGRPVVGGGYHPTLCPGDAAPHFDALVLGDAEGSWPRLIQDLEAGRLQPLYRNETPPPLDRLPAPRRDLLTSTERHYATIHAVQVGRGCPHACRYCSVTAFHRHMHRRRPVPDVLAELERIPRRFIFVDDNIIADREEAAALFRAMIPLRKQWVSQCSIRIAEDAELLDLARRAGCRGLFIGLETIRTDNLRSVGKDFADSGGYALRIRAIRRAGIGVIAGIIVGMDRDDPEVFERTDRFLRRTGIDAAQINILTPLPGTPLFDAMDRADRIIDRDWSHYDFRHCVIRPARMTPRQLKDGADWLYRRFYRLDRILLRAAAGLFSAGPVPAALSMRLGLTYRYDNLREGIAGRNPAAEARSARRRAGILPATVDD